MLEKRFKSNLKIRIHFKWLDDYFLKKAYPICLEIDPSNNCPLNCSYCCWAGLRSSKNKFLPKEKLLSLVNQASDLGVKSIIWTGGGDPLANPDTCEAISLSRRKGIDNGMFTNAVLLDSKKASILAENLNWVRFHVGSATSDGYSLMHGVKEEVFEKACENIKYFAKISKGKVKAGIGVAINQENFKYTTDLPELSRKLGLEYFQAKLDFGRISSDDYTSWWENVVIPFFKKKEKELKNVKVHVFADPIIRETDVAYCHAHNVITAITADGRVAFCKMRRDQENTSIGDIYKNSLKEIFDSKRHLKIAESIKPKSCPILKSFCPYRTTNETIEELAEIRRTTGLPHINFF